MLEDGIPVVPVQPVGISGAAVISNRSEGVRLFLSEVIDEQIQVEVSIAVVVEEGRHLGVGGIIDAIFRRHFREFGDAGGRIDAGVDIEQVSAHVGHLPGTGADIKILQTIVVDVNYGHAAAPSAGAVCAGGGGDIPKPQPSFVQVEGIGSEAGGEVQIRPTVVVEISHPDAPTVVEVLIGEHVDIAVFADVIGEDDAALLGWHGHKKRILPAGLQGEQEYRQDQDMISG